MPPLGFVRSSVAAVLAAVLLSSCTANTSDGRYVAFVQDVMSQAAARTDREETRSEQGTRSEQAVQAVASWRGESDASDGGG